MVDTKKYKELLIATKERLTADLMGIGEKNPNNPADWLPKKSETTNADLTADKNEMADHFEEQETVAQTEMAVEQELINVNKALAAIEAGTYGVCHVGDEEHPIPEGRLNANPAALTCVDHA